MVWRLALLIRLECVMRDGFVPINIKFIDRADYYTAFNEFNESAMDVVIILSN
jgi:hypothetical protein